MSSTYLHSKRLDKSALLAGFGIVELLVSISIMALVASVIIVRQNAFDSAVLLRNQAYKIALSAREVQLNAVSINGLTGDFRSLLGLHFDLNDNGKYKIFKDANNNGFYDTGEELGKQDVLDQRFEIRAIRGVGESISGGAISIVFERPNFDARFFDAPNSELTNASSIEVDIAKRDSAGSASDALRTLEVTSTGQIAVQ
jgi:type II secretory pathway pseudopilin PulG